MENCPDCGVPLTRPTEEDPPMCQRCIMASMMEDSESYTGSSDSDDYEIEREIGRGGDGTVYVGYDKKVGRRVALKLIRTLRGDNRAEERRFRAEVEAIASLDHPNIIPIYSNGELDGRLFYSMKYVDGGSLAMRMHEFSSPVEVAALMLKLARAVHHAHERGILHRDLKPSNILLDEEGEPFVSDFGLAKRPEQGLDLTLTGTIIGTPAYMSPEQARGDTSQVTTTSDVFSLGSIFYQLLTGEQTFEGETTHVVLRNVIESQVYFPQQATFKIDRDLETICLKCLEKDPEKRYQSALALAEDLERWQKGEPVEARRITTVEKTLRWMRRYPVLVGTIALAVVSLVAGTIVSVVHWLDAEEARELAEKAEEEAELSRLEVVENDYYLVVSGALAARERYEFGLARRMLDSVAPERRGIEWDLVDGFLDGDQDWSVELGDANPLHLVTNPAKENVVVLDSDRELREVDLNTGNLTFIGSLPDTPGGSPVRVRHPGLLDFDYSPDGKHYCFLDGGILVVADSETHQVKSHLSGFVGGDNAWINGTEVIHVINPLYLNKSPEGIPQLSAMVLDIETGESRYLSQKGWMAPVVLSPDEKWLIIGRVHESGRQVVGLQRLSDGVEGHSYLDTIFGEGTIDQACFSPDGKFLAYTSKSSRGSRLRLVERKGIKMHFEQVWPTQLGLCFSADSSSLLISGRESWFGSFNFQGRKPLEKEWSEMVTPPVGLFDRSRLKGYMSYYLGHESPVVSMMAAPVGDGFFTIGTDHALKKWSLRKDANSRRQVASSHATHGYGHPISSHNGDYFLIAGANLGKRSMIWHRPTDWRGQLPENQTGLAVFNDGRILCRDWSSQELVCWTMEEDRTFRELWREQIRGAKRGLGNYHIHSDMTQNERKVAVLFSGHLMKIDMETPGSRGHITGDQVMVWGSSPGQSCAISPDGRFVAVAGFLGPQARVYEFENLDKNPMEVIPEVPYLTKDSVVAYDPTGTRLYVGNNDGWVRVFEAGTWRELPDEAWRAHSTEVTAMSVARGGDVIVTAGGGNMILWSANAPNEGARRQQLNVRVGSKSLAWIKFCHNDSLLAHASPHGPLQVWSVRRTGPQSEKD